MNGTGKPTLDGCEVLAPLQATGTRSPDGAKPSKPTKRTADRFRVLNAFVDCTAAELNRSEILVWFVLYRDTRDGIACTSQADIARRAGIDDRTVRRAIRRLEREMLLKTVYRGGLNRGASKYRVLPLMNKDSQRTIISFSQVKNLGRLPWLDQITPQLLRQAFLDNFSLEDFEPQ